MATTHWLRAAAGRCSRSASAVVRREVSDSHNLTLDGCSLSREIPKAWFLTSEPFDAAGHRWRIRWYPRGAAAGGRRDGSYMSLYLELDNASYLTTNPVDFKFTLLDQAGNPVHEHSAAMEAHVFSKESRCKGFNKFMKWKDLERSGCINDDRFTVRCDVTAGFNWIETDDSTDGGGGGGGAPARGVVVPPSSLHEDLNYLLWKKQGTDVVIDVAGETFDAHGWLLMARSPVFEAALPAATKEKAASGGGGGASRRRVVIDGMEPEVFKAMLHFVYTDALPEMEEHETVAMAQGLLAAAERYKLERLKLMCEEKLCKRIDVNTVAESLAVAEEHGCHALKAACLEFIARPGNMKAVVETEGFQKTKGRCFAVMLDLAMKNSA